MAVKLHRCSNMWVKFGGHTLPLNYSAGKSFTEEVGDVLRERTPLYEAAAHYRIDTDVRTADQVAAEVARLYTRQREEPS